MRRLHCRGFHGVSRLYGPGSSRSVSERVEDGGMTENEDHPDVEEPGLELDPAIMQYRESKLTAAIRNGDHETVDRLLSDDFTAHEGGEPLDRREFLRRVLYFEVIEPASEPIWSVRDEETPPNTVSHDWTDQHGIRHVRISFWGNTEDGVQLQKHISLMRRFDGAEIRR